jgi:hypothetical protein
MKLTQEQLDDIAATFAHEPIATMDEEYIEATVRRLLNYIQELKSHNYRMKKTLNELYGMAKDVVDP